MQETSLVIAPRSLGNLGITSQTEKTESRERVPQSVDMAAGGVERSGVKANSAAAVAAAGDAVICPIDSDGEPGRGGTERRGGRIDREERQSERKRRKEGRWIVVIKVKPPPQTQRLSLKQAKPCLRCCC